MAEADREHEREKDIAKERLRAVKADAEAPSDTELDEWRRPLYTSRWMPPSADAQCQILSAVVCTE